MNENETNIPKVCLALRDQLKNVHEVQNLSKSINLHRGSANKEKEIIEEIKSS